MDINTITTLIGTVGFPIVCCLGLGWFLYKVFQKTTDDSAKNMEKVQARCAEREEKLYEQIAECQKINGEAIATITLYAERLGVIEEDVKEIKSEVDKIATKIV